MDVASARSNPYYQCSGNRLIDKIFSAIVSFFRSLFGIKDKNEKPKRSITADVDEVAGTFYRNLMDAEKKKKRDEHY